MIVRKQDFPGAHRVKIHQEAFIQVSKSFETWHIHSSFYDIVQIKICWTNYLVYIHQEFAVLYELDRITLNLNVGTPGLGYPLLLCLGKSLVVILDYVQTAGPLRSGVLFS